MKEGSCLLPKVQLPNASLEGKSCYLLFGWIWKIFKSLASAFPGKDLEGVPPAQVLVSGATVSFFGISLVSSQGCG